jgi:benzoate/toluate 1,2-dioxygenase alpha subunit/2,4,5-trichlorophenoxyacetic acid oxygenase 1
MSAPSCNPCDLDKLLDDRINDGVFRVHPESFTDPAVFDLEISRVFETTWLFLGLESEVANPHDYVTRKIGRRSVILMRDGDGILRCFFNSCRHRGTMLCPLQGGNKKLHVCRYHGWSYDSQGRNVGVTYQEHAQYPADFATEDRSLREIAQLESYRGFIFACLSHNAPSLTEHLGDAKLMLDLVADQAPDGLEYVPGAATYTFDANWKMQFENGLDAYHFPTTHAAFVNIVKSRAPLPIPDHLSDITSCPDSIAAGTINFPRGHSMSWSIGAPGQGAENRPLTRDKTLFEKVRNRVGKERLNWMLRQRNLTIFPNLQVIDIQSMQLRTWEPLSVNKTRMTSHCLAPIGEDPRAREFRIRQYEEFFNAGGLATADDNVMYEFGQAGFASSTTAPSHPYARGMAGPASTSQPFAALGLTNSTCTYSQAGLTFGDETGIHGGYREWHRLLMSR